MSTPHLAGGADWILKKRDLHGPFVIGAHVFLPFTQTMLNDAF